MEPAFVMFKPWSLHHAAEGYEEFKKYGELVSAIRILYVPRKVIEAHYAPHSEQPYFEPMVADFIGRRVEISIWHGDNVCADFRAIMPELRQRFSHDIEPSTNRHKRNALHVSDSQKQAKREIEKAWRGYFPRWALNVALSG